MTDLNRVKKLAGILNEDYQYDMTDKGDMHDALGDVQNSMDDAVKNIQKAAGLARQISDAVEDTLYTDESVKEGVAEADEAVKAWAEKYNKHMGTNGDELAHGWLQAHLNTGIESDSYNDDEYYAYNKKYKHESDLDWKDEDQERFFKESPITSAMHDEIDAIMQKYGIDEEDVNRIVGYFDMKEEQVKEADDIETLRKLAGIEERKVNFDPDDMYDQGKVRRNALEALMDMFNTAKEYEGEVTDEQIEILGGLMQDMDNAGIEPEKYSALSELWKSVSAYGNVSGLSTVKKAYQQIKKMAPEDK